MTVDGYRLPERTCRLYPDLMNCAMSSAMAFLSRMSFNGFHWRTMWLLEMERHEETVGKAAALSDEAVGILVVVFSL